MTNSVRLVDYSMARADAAKSAIEPTRCFAIVDMIQCMPKKQSSLDVGGSTHSVRSSKSPSHRRHGSSSTLKAPSHRRHGSSSTLSPDLLSAPFRQSFDSSLSSGISSPKIKRCSSSPTLMSPRHNQNSESDVTTPTSPIRFLLRRSSSRKVVEGLSAEPSHENSRLDRRAQLSATDSIRQRLSNRSLMSGSTANDDDDNKEDATNLLHSSFSTTDTPTPPRKAMPTPQKKATTLAQIRKSFGGFSAPSLTSSIITNHSRRHSSSTRRGRRNSKLHGGGGAAAVGRKSILGGTATSFALLYGNRSLNSLDLDDSDSEDEEEDAGDSLASSNGTGNQNVQGWTPKPKSQRRTNVFLKNMSSLTPTITAANNKNASSSCGTPETLLSSSASSPVVPKSSARTSTEHYSILKKQASRSSLGGLALLATLSKNTSGNHADAESLEDSPCCIPSTISFPTLIPRRRKYYHNTK